MVRNISHKPNQMFVYESPKPADWYFPEVEITDSLEWCLPWMILSETPVKGLYRFLKQLKSDGCFWNPITVWAMDDGSYKLWHGRSRYIWSKVFPSLAVSVIIIDTYGIDVKDRFPLAKPYTGNSITIDYVKRVQEDGATIFKGVARNNDRPHHSDADSMFKIWGCDHNDDCSEYDEIERTKPGVKFYYKNVFMFRWGDPDNCVDYHYTSAVDCMREMCRIWELIDDDGGRI
jgi:hypothetical protein